MIVCDGFTGNVALKLSEGLVEMVEELLGEELQSTFSSQVGYLLSRRAFRRFRKRVDYSEYGGAPLMGVAGLVHRRPRPLVGQGGAQRGGDGVAVRDAATVLGRVEQEIAARGGDPNGDCISLSRPGLAGGRHGQGARRRVSGVPRRCSTRPTRRSASR